MKNFHIAALCDLKHNEIAIFYPYFILMGEIFQPPSCCMNLMGRIGGIRGMRIRRIKACLCCMISCDSLRKVCDSGIIPLKKCNGDENDLCQRG